MKWHPSRAGRIVLLGAAMLVATPAAAVATPGGSTGGVVQRAIGDTTAGGSGATSTTGHGRTSVASTVPMTGTHHLAVVPMYWHAGTDPGTLPSADAFATVAASVDKFYDTVSGGAIRFTLDEVLTPQKAAVTSCDSNALRTAARALANVPADRFHHVIAYFPDDSGCGYAGLGEVGGNFVWLNGFNDLHVLGHELGHNLGLMHSDGYHCWSDADRINPVPLSGNCEVRGYDDPWDIMGNGDGELSAANLDLLGVLGTGGTVRATAGSRVVLAPLSGGKGVRQLTYTVGTRTYYLEYRDAGRLDQPLASWGAGLALRFTDTSLAKDYVADHQLVSFHPGVPVLRPGEGWNDPDGTFSIRTGPATADGLPVTVGPVTDIRPPSAFGLVTPAKSAMLTSTNTTVTWTPVTDESGVSSIAVLVDDTPAATVAGTATAVTVAIRDGRHTLRAVATDPYGNSSTTGAVTVTVDGSAPAGAPPPRASLIIGATVSTTSVPVQVTWGLTDPAGVARQRIAQSPGTGYTTLGTGVRQINAVTRPGTRNRWQLAVADRLGHTGTVVGDWTTTSLDTRGGTFTGAWSTVTNKALLGGSERTTTARNAAVSYTFTGRTVGLIGTRNSTSGLADVYVDGTKLDPIDLSNWRTWRCSIDFIVSWSASGTHTIKFVNRAARLNIDAFVVLN